MIVQYLPKLNTFKMKKTFLALVLLTIFACKNEVKKDLNTQIVEHVELPKFIVEMNFKTDKADAFRLMLRNVELDEFQKKDIIIEEKVSPTSSIDLVSASFGEGNISNYFSINFGKQDEKIIEIETITLSYGNNHVVVNRGNFNKYFNPNKDVSVSLDLPNIILHVDKNTNNKSNPTIYAKSSLMAELMNTKQ